MGSNTQSEMFVRNKMKMWTKENTAQRTILNPVTGSSKSPLHDPELKATSLKVHIRLFHKYLEP